mmetsp:Transcript_660/g.894  ORF Transcript_660/g.894 Transcript_660/m.894 type:complete len:133 (+) Transcript_660:637-1035(+)
MGLEWLPRCAIAVLFTFFVAVKGNKSENLQIGSVDANSVNFQVQRLRGGGKATLRRRKRDKARQIWTRANHRTRVNMNVRGFEALRNKKEQGIVGVKKIIRRMTKKFKVKTAKAKSKRRKKALAEEKFRMFQ